ncbi:hypothetical protein MMC13_002263 [Lambiella insularis]|nr:hypothetical protein [Lambiella insularis]
MLRLVSHGSVIKRNIEISRASHQTGSPLLCLPFGLRQMILRTLLEHDEAISIHKLKGIRPGWNEPGPTYEYFRGALVGLAEDLAALCQTCNTLNSEASEVFFSNTFSMDMLYFHHDLCKELTSMALENLRSVHLDQRYLGEPHYLFGIPRKIEQKKAHAMSAVMPCLDQLHLDLHIASKAKRVRNLVDNLLSAFPLLRQLSIDFPELEILWWSITTTSSNRIPVPDAVEATMTLLDHVWEEHPRIAVTAGPFLKEVHTWAHRGRR